MALGHDRAGGLVAGAPDVTRAGAAVVVVDEVGAGDGGRVRPVLHDAAVGQGVDRGRLHVRPDGVALRVNAGRGQQHPVAAAVGGQVRELVVVLQLVQRDLA